VYCTLHCTFIVYSLVCTKVRDSDVLVWVWGQRKMRQVLGTFGLMDLTMLWTVAAQRPFWNLWTIYFFNFPIFFVSCRTRQITETADMGAQLYIYFYSYSKCTKYTKLTQPREAQAWQNWICLRHSPIQNTHIFIHNFCKCRYRIHTITVLMFSYCRYKMYFVKLAALHSQHQNQTLCLM
jgi:hypothetical protein